MQRAAAAAALRASSCSSSSLPSKQLVNGRVIRFDDSSRDPTLVKRVMTLKVTHEQRVILLIKLTLKMIRVIWSLQKNPVC